MQHAADVRRTLDGVTNPLWMELIGYAGSALVVLSLTRKSILRLRTIGLAASMTFFVYALLIGAYPIAAVNVVIAAVHIYFLQKLTRRPDEVYSVLNVSPESAYLAAFLDFHRADISTFQPEFEFEPAASRFAAFVLRDMVPAGLFIGRAVDDEGVVEILLDYAIPQYRDYRVGKYLYSEEAGLLRTEGCRAALATASTPGHARYLERVGFRKQADTTGYLLHFSAPSDNRPGNRPD